MRVTIHVSCLPALYPGITVDPHPGRYTLPHPSPAPSNSTSPARSAQPRFASPDPPAGPRSAAGGLPPRFGGRQGAASFCQTSTPPLRVCYHGG
jgi:hypothetical protein